MRPNDPLDGCVGFDWDDGNVEKNWEFHRVTFWEAEEVFFNEPLVVRTDRQHSQTEPRFLALGQSDAGRLLFISFTVRHSLIRIISVRDMNRREARAVSARKRKPLPIFASEEQERSFWAEHDSTEYVQWSRARRSSFPKLRPTLRTISLRLPESMLGQLKVLANKRDVPYQSLLKQFLAERLQRELSKGARA